MKICIVPQALTVDFLPHKDPSHAVYTFKCSSGTCTATQSVWLLHCVLHCRTGPTGSSNARPTQSLQKGNKKLYQVSSWQGGIKLQTIPWLFNDTPTQLGTN